MTEVAKTPWENVLRRAAREHRRVRIRFEYQGARETEYEREWEPYEVTPTTVTAFSYYRDEYRTLDLDRITDVEVREETFQPRRDIRA